jgi:hypothetical protein
MSAKTPAHQRKLHLRIGDGDDTASRETAAHLEAKVVRRDAIRQPAGANKEEGLRMDACGGCAATGDATTSLRTKGKWEEMCQQTRGDGAYRQRLRL